MLAGSNLRLGDSTFKLVKRRRLKSAKTDFYRSRRGLCAGGARGLPWPQFPNFLDVNDDDQVFEVFRAFRAETLRAIDFTSVTSRGYCFQIDLGWRTELAGLQVVEVPITFVERAEGDSKMSADITREAIVNVAKWGVTARAEVLRDKAQGLLGR